MPLSRLALSAEATPPLAARATLVPYASKARSSAMVGMYHIQLELGMQPDGKPVVDRRTP